MEGNESAPKSPLLARANEEVMSKETDYNAFGNSLQRFDFKESLGPEGMLASDWVLPCVKFFAKPPPSIKDPGKRNQGKRNR